MTNHSHPCLCFGENVTWQGGFRKLSDVFVGILRRGGRGLDSGVNGSGPKVVLTYNYCEGNVSWLLGVFTSKILESPRGVSKSNTLKGFLIVENVPPLDLVVSRPEKLQLKLWLLYLGVGMQLMVSIGGSSFSNVSLRPIISFSALLSSL